jgi:hypothetical protein
MTEVEIKNKIISSFKKRTGNKNMIGSIEKVVDELFPDIEEAIFGDLPQGENRFMNFIVDVLKNGENK